MYGAVVVEPRDGYPTKVDREYVVMQSEFYAKPDPQKRKRRRRAAPRARHRAAARRAADAHRVQRRAQRHGEEAAAAKPGERVRLHVLNVGPSKTSSFHVVGTIFDRVWIEGNPDNQFRGMQTVLLGSSNSATVEFMIPEEGSYIMVDHHFANASQGAIGLISTAAKPPSRGLEHHNFAGVGHAHRPEAVQASRFESKCLACHSIGGEGKKLGPDCSA